MINQNTDPTLLERKQGSSNLRLMIGLSISVLFGWLALRDVNYREAASIVWDIDLIWFVIGIVVLAIGVAAKVFRWQLLFYPREKPGWYLLLSAMLIGFLVNTVLPARLGELARVYLVARRKQAQAPHILSTIVVERVFDTLTLLILLVVVAPFIAVPSLIQSSMLLLGVGALSVFAIMVLLAFQADHGLSLLSIPLRLVPLRYRGWLTGLLQNALNGLSALRNPRVHLLSWFWSLVIWGLMVVSVYATMLALHLDAPFTTAMLLVSVLNLGMVIPSSPGYIGVYHFLAVQTLAPLGVPPSLALSFAVILHLANFGSLSLGGLVCLLREGLSFGDLTVRRNLPTFTPGTVDKTEA